ncbi:MAG: hypothetical protein MR638_02700 [Lachnospiraceae bacterium]|nr:hypothetical protein [Lachnospiraceae bacterium]
MRDRDLYTRGQILLMRYCRQENIELLDLINSDKALIRCPDGGSMKITLNIYGDIMNCETGKIIAEGDNPHTLWGPQEWPTKWTPVAKKKSLSGPEEPKHCR